jgi:hypothetical protein
MTGRERMTASQPQATVVVGREREPQKANDR